MHRVELLSGVSGRLRWVGVSLADGVGRPRRVFISYAHDDAGHERRVMDLWLLLRASGLDARLDRAASGRPLDWSTWMLRQVREADFVLVVASPAYKRRAEGDEPPGKGLGVRWEARLIRQQVYADEDAAVLKFLPVVLPGGSAADIPTWLGSATHTHYVVSDYTVAGAEQLLRYLTDQPLIVAPALGPLPSLPPEDLGSATAIAPAGEASGPVGLRTEVVVRAEVTDGMLATSIEVAGTPTGQHRQPLPPSVADVWAALGWSAGLAAERLAATGRELGVGLFDERSRAVVAGLASRLRPGDGVDVVLCAAGEALGLPLELVRLPAGAGADGPPLCLQPGVTLRRQVMLDAPAGEPVRLAGPLKVLAAVAAPEETRTASTPLDVEAEMQAILDAAGALAGEPDAQVRILEVASLGQIRAALAADAYHVLHLSAHGSATTVELEDEDGAPVPVGADDVIAALRHAGRPVPLIVLSACSGAAGAGAQALAAGLVAHGADRVLAMQASISDTYATRLAAALYRELAGDPSRPLAQVLARARYALEQELSREHRDRPTARPPEYGVATLLCAGPDAGLLDAQRPVEPLTRVTSVPAGGSVRAMKIGQLIGRRAQVRGATAVLRRTPRAVDEHGVAGGVVLVGVGGIGKTAVAGRVSDRLREGGWRVAVHDGRWNPGALFTAVAAALAPAAGRTGAEAAEWARAAADLTNPAVEDLVKLALLHHLVASTRLLLVFDDFEQNLTPGGQAFLDPTLEAILAGLANAAATGGLLLTSRYPIPAAGDDLVPIEVPALSASELRRLFLRLPALRDLDTEDRRLLTRTIGGHPRLIEFVDALMRGGRSNLAHVRDKLRTLADRERLTLGHPRTAADAVRSAMLLGAADILLDDLLDLLTPDQLRVLHQVAVCRAPMTLADLDFALAGTGTTPPDPALADAVTRLTDLTLLAPGAGIHMHPWTADLVTRRPGTDLTDHHERALQMRQRRLQQDRGSYDDLLDIARHQSHLRRFAYLAEFADRVAERLPGTLARLAYLAAVVVKSN